jgi:uncharacterized membrane protein YoaK (UPF0700 family)
MPASYASKLSWQPTVPLLLGVNGGFVDTAGFLALQGLFTAHVTGNFVTLGAALVFGNSGTTAKVLALPTFCAVILIARLASHGLVVRGMPVLRTLLTLKVVLLAAAAALAIRYGPFSDGDSGLALTAGLTLVSAMAIQNAAHRIYLGSAPPSTIMTGTTTQMMIDVADLLRHPEADKKDAARIRLIRAAASVFAFALGCAAAALCFAKAGVYCFLVPPILGLGTLLKPLAAFEPH